MKTIAFYITDSGFGHVTRCLALIEHILALSDNHIYLVCGEEQVEYSQVFLSKHSHRLTYQIIHTEPSTIIKDKTFDIDVEKTTDSIKAFMATLENVVKNECITLKTRNVTLVVTDISIIGIKVAQVLSVPVIGITNYTPYHRYKKLGIPQEIIQPFYDSYNQLNLLLRYAFSDDLTDLTCPEEKVGIVARRVNEHASCDIKSSHWPSCFLSIGQSAHLDTINISFSAGNVMATGNMDITGNSHVIKLPKRVAHSQDYISASSLAIVKPGWSIVAECMISGIPFAVINVNDIEDGDIIKKLIATNICHVLTFEDFKELDIKKLNMKIATKHTEKVPNDAENIAKRLLSFQR